MSKSTSENNKINNLNTRSQNQGLPFIVLKSFSRQLTFLCVFTTNFKIDTFSFFKQGFIACLIIKINCTQTEYRYKIKFYTSKKNLDILIYNFVFFLSIKKN